VATFLDGEAVRRARVELGLTQEQVATRLGIDVRSYRRYESGAVNHPARGFLVRHASRRRVVDRLCAELGIAEAELLVARTPSVAPSPAPEPEPGPEPGAQRWAHPLAPARHFVGRTALLDELVSWLRDPAPAARVLSIVAVGGAGKSALLERALRAGTTPPGGGLLVWSLYEDRRVEALIAEGCRTFAGASRHDPSDGPRRPPAIDERERLHGGGSRQLGSPLSAAGASRHEGDEAPTLDHLLDLLRAGPHVLALDGLEVLQADGRGGRARGELEDPALRRLLRSLAAGGAGGARAIVTSRFPLADVAEWTGAGAREVRLPDLEPAEAATLLAGWGVLGSEADRERLAARLGGHALSVAVAGSFAGSYLGGDPTRLGGESLEAAAQDDPRARRLGALLARYSDALSPLERDLLARLALFPAGVPPDTLAALSSAGGVAAGALAGADPAELARAATRLERLGLASSGQDGLLVHPFVRTWFAEQLGGGGLREAVQAVERDRLRDRPGGRAGVDLDAVEALLHATLRAGEVGAAFLLYRQGLGGFGHLGLQAGAMHRGARVVRAFGGDDPATLGEGLPPELRAALAYDAGLYAGALGDLQQAERCYAAHAAFLEPLDPRDTVVERATNLRTRAYVARLRGDLPLARDRAEAAVQLSRGHAAHHARCLALAASVAHDLGDVAAAAAGFARVRDLEGAPEARRALWEAEHLLALGQRDEARALGQAVERDCAARGWAGHTAHARTLLGRVGLAMGQLDEAEEHAQAARRWCDRSGEVEMRLRLLLLEGELALARGEPGEAGRAGDDARSLADGAGFVRAGLRARLVLAGAALALRSPGQARAHAEAALATADAGADAWTAADALEQVARAADAQGDPVAARRAEGEARLRWQRLGATSQRTSARSPPRP
jgi:transcriptional regulator with XRE-family HTH domain